jgi:hypothetical protein
VTEMVGQRRSIVVAMDWTVTGTPPPPRLRRPGERDLRVDSTM